MRKFIASVVFFLALVLLFSSGGYSQPGKGKGGFNKGGGKGGDFFDRYAQGKPTIDVSAIQDARSRDLLLEFATARGISPNSITRDQFSGYGDFLKEKFSGGGKMKGGQKGGPTKGGPLGTPAAPAPDPTETWNKMAEFEFNRLDTNSDKILVETEMPKPLLDDLSKWDKNGDKQLTLEEFKAYYLARQKEIHGKDFSKFNPGANLIATIIIEEDWDRRPVVLRAGHLHKDLPKWFAELDKNKDGQVSLAEWMDGKKDYEEFVRYDRNDDALLTQEEVLRWEAIVKAGQDGKETPSLAFDFTKSSASSKFKPGEGYKKGMPDYSGGNKKKKKGG